MKGIKYMDLKKEILANIEHITNENELKNIYIATSDSITIQRNKYNEWLNNQTEDIINLHIKVTMLEDYFDDMILDKKSIMGKYLKTPFKHYINDTESLSLDAHFYRLYIYDNIEKYDAILNKSSRSIIINRSCVNNQNIILHEMLHAHEQIINSINPIIRDTLIIELYNKLKKFITSIDEIIYNHANIYHNMQLTEIGGEHSLLFLLKSLELDLRCNNELFTIFGYDYNRHFKMLNLI